MGFLDHRGGVEFPYPRDDVFTAVIEAIPKIKGMKIDRADKLAGHIVVKAGVSLRSWGENIPISIMEVAPGRTRLEITSTPKMGAAFGGAIDLGKNRSNIEKILDETSKVLKGKPPTPPSSGQPVSGDVAERLKKLKDLLDSGLIEKGDYEKRKAELLSQV